MRGDPGEAVCTSAQPSVGCLFTESPWLGLEVALVVAAKTERGQCFRKSFNIMGV